MTDHEAFRELAARAVDGDLTAAEATDLASHLDACPSCRAFAAGLRRDDLLLRATIDDAPVASRIRDRVLAEARGESRRFDGRLILVLAAALALAAIGIPILAGRAPDARPSTPPTTVAPSPAPSASDPGFAASPSPTAPVVASPEPSPAGASVNGAYGSPSTPPTRARRDGTRSRPGSTVAPWANGRG